MSIALTAAGRRRKAGLCIIRSHVDELLEQSKQTRDEALETLAAITRRSEQNHIAAGVALAFAERRKPRPAPDFSHRYRMA